MGTSKRRDAEMREALKPYFLITERPLEAIERRLAQRQQWLSLAESVGWSLATTFFTVFGLLVFLWPSDMRSILDTVIILGSLAAAVAFGVQLRGSERRRLAARTTLRIGTVSQLDVIPEACSEGHRENRACMAMEDAILRLTGRDVEWRPERLPCRIEMIGDRLVALDGRVERDFRWLKRKLEGPRRKMLTYRFCEPEDRGEPPEQAESFGSELDADVQ